jgi:hypothetical protein
MNIEKLEALMDEKAADWHSSHELRVEDVLAVNWAEEPYGH